jgi:hypothetical protein
MLTQEEEAFKARLAELQDLLSTIKPTRFKFTSWVGLDWGGLPDLSCGTTACAFGWATTLPSLKALGLALYKTDGGFITPAMSKEAVLENAGAAAEDAAEEVFGLSVQEFNYLFIPREDFDDFGIFSNEDYEGEFAEPNSLSEELSWQKETFGRFGCPRSATASDVAENIAHFISVKYGN